MRVKMIAAILAAALLFPFALNAEDKNEKKRDKSRKMAAKTLKELYKLEPTFQAAIQKSAGYAVFG